MTEQQRSQFSSAWQALFARLEAKGYTVTWNGRICITNGVNSMTARLEHMLGDTAHRWEFDLTLRRVTA